MKLIERQRIDSKFRKKYDTPATPCDRLLACAKVSEETKAQLRATRSALDPMDLAADIEARLARIFTLVERIEEDRQDEMNRAGETHPQLFHRAGLRCGFGRYRSLRLHSVRPGGKACQHHPKNPTKRRLSFIIGAIHRPAPKLVV